MKLDTALSRLDEIAKTEVAYAPAIREVVTAIRAFRVERHRAEAALRKERRKFRDLADELRELQQQGAHVVSRWESGDLADAVNGLQALIPDDILAEAADADENDNDDDPDVP